MPVRVVIAEDEWLLAAQLCIQVESHGYHVIGKARTGIEAVEMCCATRPDVVLMDVQMPELNGIDATLRLMQECPAPVVIVTGNARLRGAAHEAGAMGFVIKPLLADQIPLLVADARERFACFMAVSNGSADLRAALGTWLPAQDAAELLMESEAVSWGDAFRKMQGMVSDGGVNLRDAALQILHTS